MPLLGPDDALPHRPQRVLVAGSSGAGKTTVAAAVAGVLGVPRVEMDALFHGPAWTPRPSFLDDVSRVVASPAWVTEWQYPAARQLLLERADLLVWLDVPRVRAMRQVTARTLRRRWRREVLWNGNVEPPLRTVFSDPEHLLRWTRATHAHTATRVAVVLERVPDLAVVRLRDRRAVHRWLTGPLRRTVEDA